MFYQAMAWVMSDHMRKRVTTYALDLNESLAKNNSYEDERVMPEKNNVKTNEPWQE